MTTFLLEILSEEIPAKMQKAAAENFVTSIPTVIFTKDGVAKQRFTGIQPKSMYVDTINSLK